MKKIVAALTLCLFLFSNFSFAERIGSHTENWKTIKTPHFDIIFSAQQQDLGLYYAQVAERAYQNLKNVFLAAPERTVLVINDSTDISNGYATRVPYPLIMAYPVQVAQHDSLSEAGEWARELITHEMTHILQFEPANGFYTYLRPIFGTIIAPNLLMPTWWKEGMAVEMETQFSNGGRLRSTYQDASVRAFVLDMKLFKYSIDQINEVLPSWPYGSRSYLFGSLFWSQISKENNRAAINQIVQHQGYRVPYFIEEPMLELSQQTYEDRYLKTLLENNSNAIEQLNKIKTTPPTEFKVLKSEGQTAINPIYSEKFKWLAFLDSKDGTNEITIQTLDGKVLKHLKERPSESIQTMAFHPFEKKIIYSKVKLVSNNESLSDLYIYDIETDRSERLTTRARARDPQFSADGKKIVYVSTFNGKSQVKILNLETKELILVQESAFSERIYDPIFWDDSTLLFTKRLANRDQIIIQHNLMNNSEEQILKSISDAHFLKKVGSDLYFTSNLNGVFNIYRSRNFEEPKPITNAQTGIWSFDVDISQEKIWAAVLTSDGFKIAESTMNSSLKTLPAIENKVAERYQFADLSSPVSTPEPEEYSASSYLIPSYWIPYIASSATNGIYAQAQTSGQDPLQIHKYSLVANYQTDINKGGFNGSYTNSAFAIPFQFSVIQSNKAYGNINNVVETKTSQVSVLPDVFNVNKNLLLQAGVHYSEINYLASNTQHAGPFLQFAYSDYSQNIFQISAEKGWGALLRYEKNLNITNTIDFNKVYGTLIGFYSNGLPQHHVFMSRINGLFTFESVSSRFGSSSSSSFLMADYLIPEFVVRGYPASQFYGRSLWTINTEYRFPIMPIEKGSGTTAVFAKRLSAAIVADGLGVKGAGVAEDNSVILKNLNESVWSAGLEAKLETTIGYVIPMNLIVGYYKAFSPVYASSPQTAISLQIGGL